MLECSSSWSGRSAIRTAGLPSIRQTRPIVPAGDRVGDEQLLAVDDVIVAVEHGPSSAGRSGRSRRRARSARSAESRSPLARPGRKRRFCSALPKVRSGSTAPMQPWTEARPATVGVDRRHAASGTARMPANGAPGAAVLADRPAGPSSRRCPVLVRRLRRSSCSDPSRCRQPGA